LLADPLALGALIVGSSVPAVSVVVEARSPASMVPLSRFRSNIFSGTNLLTLLLYAALGRALFRVPFDLFLPFFILVLSSRLYRSPPTVFDRLSNHPTPKNPTPKELVKDWFPASYSLTVQALRFGLKLRWGGTKKRITLPAF
jgi:hypothetical protein